MKKKNIIIYILTALISFLIVFGALYLIEIYKAKKMVKDFDKTFKSNELQVVFYARRSCYFCNLEKPILKEISREYNIKYLNIEADDLNNKQKKHILDKLDVDGSTPVTAVVKDSKVIAKHVGYLDGKEYVDFFIEAGILKEGSKYKKEDKIKFVQYEDAMNLTDGILVLGMIASPDCIDLRSTINDISKEYSIEFNYINLSKTSKDQFFNLVSHLNDINLDGKNIVSDENLIVPNILIIKDNKIIDAFNETNSKSIVNKLKDNNIIK